MMLFLIDRIQSFRTKNLNLIYMLTSASDYQSPKFLAFGSLHLHASKECVDFSRFKFLTSSSEMSQKKL